GVVAIVGLPEVDQTVLRRPALLVGRLGGRDVHPAVDLARVRRHDFDRQPPGKRDGGGRLAHARGPGDDEQRRLVGHQWQSTLRPRLALPPAVALDAAIPARTLAPLQARLGPWGPSPTTSCGSHYHVRFSSRRMSCMETRLT